MTPLANFIRFVLLWIVLAVAAVVGLGWWGLGIVAAVGVVYWLFVLRGGEARKAKTVEKLMSTLMTNEQKIGDAMQLRLCALTSRRVLVAATSSRVILIKRPMLGGFSMEDYQWKDLHDATLAENVLPNLFGSRLVFSIRRDGQEQVEGTIVADGLDARIAARLYTAAQDQEQAWEEKRRVRTMEEAGAKELFEAPHAVTDRALRNTEFVRGLRKTQVARDRFESDKLGEGRQSAHGCILRQAPPALLMIVSHAPCGVVICRLQSQARHSLRHAQFTGDGT